jgi:hypothetical protein
MSGFRHLLHRVIENCFVGFRRLVEAAEFSYELE